MAASPDNRLIELKIDGRYHMLLVWATKLGFELKPNPSFDKRAWKLWRPILLLLNAVCKKEKLRVDWVRTHSHFNLKVYIPHAMGPELSESNDKAVPVS